MKTKNHIHIYDEQGRQLCCTQEKKIYTQAGAMKLITSDEHCCSCNSDINFQKEIDQIHSAKPNNFLKLFLVPTISLSLLLVGILFDFILKGHWFSGWIRILLYVAAYIPVGFPVLKDAWESIKKGEVFSEFLLMGIATIGAFAIGEYPEGVAVMLFYTVGEVFQTLAVSKAKNNVKSLLDQRPDEVTVLKGDRPETIKAKHVKIGDIIQLKPGEKLGLDGELLSESASFNTSALTGESVPDTKKSGESVLAGMINLNTVSRVKVTTAYENSKLSKILELVQNATAQKAPTELFIRKFAKIYTPIVVALAIAICVLPIIFVEHYVFRDWLYRALIFLVISCPCALVISIPLGYFGGIGAASRNGILFKGGNFLDALATIKNVVMDKTGTMTEGVFNVQEVTFDGEYDKLEILQWVNVLESHSSHPVATAINRFVGEVDHSIKFNNVEEFPGLGLKGVLNGKELLVGNFKLMDKFRITYTIDPDSIVYTVVAVAFDQKFVGYITIADSLKSDARAAIDKLKSMHIHTLMLSGDKSTVVKFVAKQLGIDQAYGDLLPEDKVDKIKEIIAKNESIVFVGDGVNDAPVVAISDVGIAMGGLGSDVTIETADVVIQDDKPSKIPVAIEIGKQTQKIVWQNILLAFSVKGLVLLLGAMGIATMWEAVFADVGVALIAILNAVRIQRMKF